MPQEHCVFLKLFVFPSHLSQPLYVWFYCTDCSLAIGCTCSKAGTQTSACPHWSTPSPKSCSVTSRLQTGGQQEARCSSKQDYNFFHNLCEPKEQGSMGWSTICWHPLHWLLALGHCTFWLAPTALSPQGDTVQQAPALPQDTGHGGVPKGKRKENTLPSYSRAA